MNIENLPEKKDNFNYNSNSNTNTNTNTDTNSNVNDELIKNSRVISSTKTYSSKSLPKKSGYSPIIVGHRGHYKTLENSLLGFKECIEKKLPMIELDIWLTKDNVPVVIHTNTETYCISQTASGVGKVCEFTSAEIKLFKLGIETETIPTLEEVLILCKDKLRINIEIKEIEKKEEILKIAIELVYKYNMEHYVLFSSFFYEYYDLLRFTLNNKEIEFKYNVNKDELFDDVKQRKQINNKDDKDSIGNLYNTSTCIRAEMLDKEKIDWFHSNKMKVSIYFYPDNRIVEEKVIKLLELGVDEFIVDEPDKCQEIIAKYLDNFSNVKN